jgi:hypothetical protein
MKGREEMIEKQFNSTFKNGVLSEKKTKGRSV